MRFWKFGAFVLGLLAVACGGASGTVETESQSAGTLEFPLVASTSDGSSYRVVGAKFDITGPQNVSVTDTSNDTVQTTLLAGDYTVQLGGTWHLESVAAPGIVIPAQLLSPNPLPFSIFKEQTTSVRLRFKIPGNGTADMGITVDSGGWLAGTLHFQNLEKPDAPSPFAELVGKDVPFLISYESSILMRDAYAQFLNAEARYITVQFGGANSALLSRVASSLNDAQVYFNLRSAPGGNLTFGGVWISGPSGEFQLELAPSAPFPGTSDSYGVPNVQNFVLQTDFVLRSRDSSNAAVGRADVNGLP